MRSLKCLWDVHLENTRLMGQAGHVAYEQRSDSPPLPAQELRRHARRLVIDVGALDLGDRAALELVGGQLDAEAGVAGLDAFDEDLEVAAAAPLERARGREHDPLSLRGAFAELMLRGRRLGQDLLRRNQGA